MMYLDSLNQQIMDVLQNPERLATISQINWDRKSEKVFDRLTRHAARLVPAPVSLVSIVMNDRQLFKSAVGLTEPWVSAKQTPLTHSFCQHVVASAEPLIIEDARQHPLVKDNMAIQDLGVISYLGMPLTMQNGHTLGSFCVIDTQPREWTQEEVDFVKELADIALTEIETHYELAQLRGWVQRYETLVDNLGIANQYLESIVESQNTFIVRTDLRGRYTFVNEVMYQQFTWQYDTREDMIGTSSIAAFIEDDHDLALEMIERCIANPEQAHQVALRKARPEANDFWILWELSAIYDETGEIQEIQWVGIDITGRKKVEQQAFELAIEREKMGLVSQFVQQVAHEFRTPLSIINLNANMMVRLTEVEKRQQKSQRIDGQVQRITKLVDTLSLITRLETIKTLACEDIDLNAIIQTVVSRIMANDITKPALTLELQNDLPRAKGNVTRLTQAIEQVLDNAIRFTPEDGKISIETSTVENRVRMHITDTGCGIDTQDLPHIFDLLWRKDTAGTTPGLGLGLPIAKKIIDLHEGQLEVESIPDNGVTVTITLPIA